MIYLYYWLLQDTEHRSNTVEELNFGMSYSTLGAMNWSFAFIVLMQLLMLLRSLYFSIQLCELASCSESQNHSLLEILKVPVPARKLWSKLWKRYIESVFFIHGKHFDHYFLFREYVEVVCQLYQGYKMSIYVATRWINDLFIGMIFLNCASTPIIHRLVPSSKVPLRRLISVIFSAFLNFINSVVIPFVMFMPYTKVFNLQTLRFQDHLLLDDVWYANAVRENQQLFVTGYFDYVATWMPHWSLFSCLVTYEDLLRRSRVEAPRRSLSVVPVSSLPGDVSSPTNALFSQTSRFKLAPRQETTVSKTISALRYNVLWIIGVVVLGIHIAAQNRGQVDGCQLASTPWFVLGTPCVIMSLNCYRRGIQGLEQQIDSILSRISADTLFDLTVAHCPRLQVPPVLRKFTHLGGFCIYNSTIDQWQSDASLCESAHPELNFFFVIQTKMAAIPDGLLDRSFPSSLGFVFFHDTNLTALPEDLHEIWTSPATLIFEFSQLQEYQSTFAKMKAVRVCLTGNPFSHPFNTSYLSESHLQMLTLSNSSLAALTEDPPPQPFDQLFAVFLEYTKLTEIPPYLRSWYMNRVNAHKPVVHSLFGSAYCQVTIPAEQVEEKTYQSRVCARDLRTSKGFLNVQVITNRHVL